MLHALEVVLCEPCAVLLCIVVRIAMYFCWFKVDHNGVYCTHQHRLRLSFGQQISVYMTKQLWLNYWILNVYNCAQCRVCLFVCFRLLYCVCSFVWSFACLFVRLFVFVFCIVFVRLFVCLFVYRLMLGILNQIMAVIFSDWSFFISVCIIFFRCSWLLFFFVICIGLVCI